MLRPQDDQRPRGRRGHRRRRRRGARGGGLRPDPARAGAVALALRERALLAAARLPRRGAGGARRDGRRRRDGRHHHVHGGRPRHRADPDGGADGRGGRRGGRRAARAPRATSARRCWCGRSTRSRPARWSPGCSPRRASRSRPKIGPEDRALDLRHPAAQLARRVRALAPHIGATAVIDGQPFKVWGARTVSEPVPAGAVRGAGAPARRHRGGDARDHAPAAAGEGPDGRRRLPARLPRPARVGVRVSTTERAAGGITPRAHRRPARAAPGGRGRLRRPCPGRRGAPRRARPARPRQRDPAGLRRRAAHAARSTGSSTARSTGRTPWSPPSATSCGSARTRSRSRTASRDHAAVDQAVRQARSLRGAKARSSARAGLVNAVMRRIAADAPGRLAELEAGGAATAGLRHSMPDWIVARLVASLGRGGRRRRHAGGRRARRVGRALEPAAGAAGGPRGRAARGLDAATPRSPRPTSCAGRSRSRTRRRGSAAWRSGRAAPRSSWHTSSHPARASGSWTSVPRPAPRPPTWRRWRAAARASPPSSCTRPARRRCARWRPGWAPTSRWWRATRGRCRWTSGFDAVLVDPPCTGLGVLSSRPDARWRGRESSLGPLTELQRGGPGPRAGARAARRSRRVLDLHADRTRERGRGARDRRAPRRPGRRAPGHWRTRACRARC